MSKSRYYLICIFLADLAGIALSSLYGTIVPGWIGSWLPAPLGFLRTAAMWLYHLPLLLLPHTWQVVLIRQPGRYWLGITLFIHLWLLIAYLLRRRLTENLGEPHPGGPYWETVQDLFKSYREAMQRWKPKWALKTPTWRYYKRQDSTQPDIYWHGRVLIIERGMFAQDRYEELATAIARELMYYNSDDLWVKDLLSYYPSGLQIFLFLSGFCILLPALIIKESSWASHWEKRSLVADRFAYLVGQGLLLFQQVLLQLRQEDQLPELRRAAAQEIEEVTLKRDTVQRQINAHKTHLMEKRIQERYQRNSYYQSGYQSTTTYPSSFLQPQTSAQGQETEVIPEDETLHLLRQQRNQFNQEITALQERKLQLAVQEQQSYLIRPMLEHRMEQLAGLLNTEREWMRQRHLPIPPVYQTIEFTPPSTRSTPTSLPEIIEEHIWTDTQNQ
jgi:hypothetical protein